MEMAIVLLQERVHEYTSRTSFVPGLGNEASLKY